ncbi:TPA: hypothetical protein CPT79_09150 [Candidatus Gastranaerophilales bacterium HUM_6]|nr:MAG TPA: hypothetical protein CPT79_09150 [Candidatus Gastranaerophilales bacterium HUM_6]DAA94999.1 MAG TPA: hypothetical protein CPT93_01785 [Candidatus Gastranaerophilales bacterium HUM_7]DAB04024.1 MAG TPA: hypothetical protein CPT84_01150 [Candidatus Gastranaerophilales bacterium HUM_12]DAB08546.1 MAG TPA: hypothetical protein CPT78_01485 [Candidatus Gastranaerophilales bacterium HUM_14]
MKIFKFVLPIIGIILTFSDVYAQTPQDGIAFFNQYQNFANSYNDKILDMYSPNAKIIREVIKPSGEAEQVIVPAERYFKELKIGQKTAKLRKYRNSYKNVIAQKVQNGIKVSAERQPSRESYWLKMYQIYTPTDSGLKITEEMMQTKVQSFLRHKNKG